ncbi:CBS domain-containing protein [Pseudemcibacter aquimaris]|uniref:CBS domain-containing protein n=1 Tax=Pseudemcibacter aquimaris TaxID=2857064 RepID=UPI002011268A|nr:CBS domain-containing protein [Pseudemcibacter aquimaris]MCC3862587.1 CBS domain-containing protein [Pseudemcibacter aquimaris]WDU57895.1 CBS domain-containing protein [Pseudemcibacter aquimaris]
MDDIGIITIEERDLPVYVKNILSRKGNDVVKVSPENTLLETARVLRENKIGAVLACDTDGKMCGVISERDIVISVARSGAIALERKVDSCMTTGVYTCTENDSIKEVMEVMTSRRIAIFRWWVMVVLSLV